MTDNYQDGLRERAVALLQEYESVLGAHEIIQAIGQAFGDEGDRCDHVGVRRRADRYGLAAQALFSVKDS